MTDEAGRALVHTGPDGRAIGAREAGDPRGRPLFYCHGTPGSRLEPRVLADAAARLGLRVLCVERPGYGATDPMPGRRVGDAVDDIAVVADALDIERFDALGFSGGGPQALALAARIPERVRTVGLAASWAPFDAVCLDGMADGYRALWDLARTDFDAFADALRDALEQAGDAYALLHGGASEADRAILEAPETAAAYRESMATALAPGMTGLLDDARAMIEAWRFDTADVACPVHLHHGDADGNAPVGMGRWLAARLPEATLTEWPGAGHFEAFRRWPEILAPHAQPGAKPGEGGQDVDRTNA